MARSECGGARLEIGAPPEQFCLAPILRRAFVHADGPPPWSFQAGPMNA